MEAVIRGKLPRFRQIRTRSFTIQFQLGMLFLQTMAPAWVEVFPGAKKYEPLYRAFIAFLGMAQAILQTKSNRDGTSDTEAYVPSGKEPPATEEEPAA